MCCYATSKGDDGIWSIFEKFIEKIFYPGNDKRRDEVNNLSGEIKACFSNYKKNWNKLASVLNDILKTQTSEDSAGVPYSQIQILKLNKDIEQNAINDCVNEINNVIKDTQEKIRKLISDAGVEQFLPSGWSIYSVNINDVESEDMIKIGLALTTEYDGGLSAFLSYFVFAGMGSITIMYETFQRVRACIDTLSEVALSASVILGPSFIIADIISGAISGARERDRLNEAIKTLQSIKSTVASPLRNASTQVSAILNQINIEAYRLDDTHLLVKMLDGSFHIFGTKDSVGLSDKINLAALKLSAVSDLTFLSA